jgi:hypothetical protein
VPDQPCVSLTHELVEQRIPPSAHGTPLSTFLTLFNGIQPTRRCGPNG